MSDALPSLFIPKKIRVGYQNRPDTYTKRLAYVIYYDNKGKIRKEVSWKSWVDPKIPADEFENKPQSGFVLNKNVERFRWSHFGSGRSYIRIYDPRGIEFEITPENLIGILMNTTCSKRGLDGEFVYAWVGGDLVVLPTNSEEYQQAVQYTNLQDAKVSLRTMKEGCSFTTKKGEEIIYVGRFNWYHWNVSEGIRKPAKKLIFMQPDGTFVPKGDVSFLAHCNNPDPVSNYAEIVDKFKSDIHSGEIVSFETTPVKVDLDVGMMVRYGREMPWIKKETYHKIEKDEMVFCHIEPMLKYSNGYDKPPVHLGTYKIQTQYFLDTKTWRGGYHEDKNGYRQQGEGQMTREEAEAFLANAVEVRLVLDTGGKWLLDKDYYRLGDR